MSKRIKELIEQSITIEEYGWGASYENFDREKFAQLIVKECRDIVSDTRDLAIEDGWNVDEAMSTAMYDIEVHFGVE
jgi:hypothetical protein